MAPTNQSWAAKIQKMERSRRSTFFATATRAPWKIPNPLARAGRKARRILLNPEPNRDATSALTLHENDRWSATQKKVAGMKAAIIRAAACLRMGAPRKISGHIFGCEIKRPMPAIPVFANEIDEIVELGCAFEE